MRDLIPLICLVLKVIKLFLVNLSSQAVETKLFLDMVPSSPADANERCVDVLECFFSQRQSETQ